MGERKVLNMYIPPDFDPSRMPKGKRDAKNACDVTMMLPMSVQCNTCSHFMYKGTKFNTRKEDVVGRDHLGIKIIRFIFKCRECNAHFSIVTDPANMDYAVEYGVTRNFEPWRQERAEREADKADREALDADAAASLEARTLESKRSMEISDALEELGVARRRQAGLTTEDLLRAVADKHADVDDGAAAQEVLATAAKGKEEKEDAAAAAAAFAAARAPVKVSAAPGMRPGVLSMPRLVPTVRKNLSVTAPTVPRAGAPSTEPIASAGTKRPRSPERIGVAPTVTPSEVNDIGANSIFNGASVDVQGNAEDLERRIVGRRDDSLTGRKAPKSLVAYDSDAASSDEGGPDCS